MTKNENKSKTVKMGVTDPNANQDEKAKNITMSSPENKSKNKKGISPNGLPFKCNESVRERFSYQRKY